MPAAEGDGDVLPEAEAVADRVTIIRKGKTVETGTLADLRHLTRISVEAELSVPAALDEIPGVHELTVTGTVVRARVDPAFLDEVVGRLHHAGIRSLTCRPRPWRNYSCATIHRSGQRPGASHDRLGWHRATQQARLPSRRRRSAAAANAAIALLTFLWLSRLGLPVAGSAALALSISGCGLVFGGVAAVTAQLAVTGRGARGLAIAALGAALLFGLLPWESTALAWTAVALAEVIAVFGPPLQWPAWMMDISPFTEIPKLPGGTMSAEPLLWLSGIVMALSVAGWAGLRRRDIGDLGPSHLVGAIRDRIAAYAREDHGPSQPASARGTVQPPEQPAGTCPHSRPDSHNRLIRARRHPEPKHPIAARFGN